MNYLAVGTWQDASDRCNERGAHLWTPNDYTEWWNVYNILSSSLWENGIEMNEATSLILSTIVLFIGMHAIDDVSRLRGFCIMKSVLFNIIFFLIF